MTETETVLSKGISMVQLQMREMSIFENEISVWCVVWALRMLSRSLIKRLIKELLRTTDFKETDTKEEKGIW